MWSRSAMVSRSSLMLCRFTISSLRIATQQCR
jgi:hypothetical protein